MGGLCCRRRADGHDVDDGHDDHDVDVDSVADVADEDEATATARDEVDEVISPLSPHLAPAPAWGRSFLEGRELRRRAGVDSESIEVQ